MKLRYYAASSVQSRKSARGRLTAECLAAECFSEVKWEILDCCISQSLKKNKRCEIEEVMIFNSISSIFGGYYYAGVGVY